MQYTKNTSQVVKLPRYTFWGIKVVEIMWFRILFLKKSDRGPKLEWFALALTTVYLDFSKLISSFLGKVPFMKVTIP